MSEVALEPLRDNTGRFQAGQTGNSLGRPKGSRNAVSEAFLQDIYAVWTEATTEENGLSSTIGINVLRTVAKDQPAKLLAAMVQVLPKDFQVTVDTDQVNWVINASPRLTVEEWQAQHGLDSPTMDEKDTE